MMTKRVAKGEYGSILGVSSSFTSAANAISPLIGGLLFQQFGATVPFLLGGILMFGILALSLMTIRPLPQPSTQE
jgi:predicted MFS family arabinose efflux permease